MSYIRSGILCGTILLNIGCNSSTSENSLSESFASQTSKIAGSYTGVSESLIFSQAEYLKITINGSGIVYRQDDIENCYRTINYSILPTSSLGDEYIVNLINSTNSGSLVSITRTDIGFTLSYNPEGLEAWPLEEGIMLSDLQLCQ